MNSPLNRRICASRSKSQRLAAPKKQKNTDFFGVFLFCPPRGAGLLDGPPLAYLTKSLLPLEKVSGECLTDEAFRLRAGCGRSRTPVPTNKDRTHHRRGGNLPPACFTLDGGRIISSPTMDRWVGAGVRRTPLRRYVYAPGWARILPCARGLGGEKQKNF